MSTTLDRAGRLGVAIALPAGALASGLLVATASKVVRRDIADWRALTLDGLTADLALVAVAVAAMALIVLAAITVLAQVLTGPAPGGRPSLRRRRLAERLDALAESLTPALLRRLLVAACGVGVVAPSLMATAASAQPGVSDPAPDRPPLVCVVGLPSLEGLRLPDLPVRALDQSQRRPHRIVKVGPGDSLWLIAERLLPPDSSPASTVDLVNRLYRLNRRRIGNDPNLIFPGTRLIDPEGHP